MTAEARFLLGSNDMVAASGNFDEPTRIHSSDQLDQMLEQARSRVDEVVADFEGSEHTMMGDMEALAQSMKVVDEAPVPAPVSTRQSARHIVRRPSSSIPVRSTTQTPVRALGSMSDISKPACKQDEDAFEPWNDIDAEPMQAAPEPALVEAVPEATPRRPITAPIPALPSLADRIAAKFDFDDDDDDVDEVVEQRVERPTQEMAPIVIAEEPVAHATVQEAPVEAQHAEPARVRTSRWAVFAWVALLVGTIAIGTVAYVRLTALEQELAATKAQLQK